MSDLICPSCGARLVQQRASFSLKTLSNQWWCPMCRKPTVPGEPKPEWYDILMGDKR